jgi:hypothetical protein
MGEIMKLPELKNKIRKPRNDKERRDIANRDYLRRQQVKANG